MAPENLTKITVRSSLALAGLPITLINQTLQRLEQETNGRAALWFAQQIRNGV